MTYQFFYLPLYYFHGVVFLLIRHLVADQNLLRKHGAKILCTKNGSLFPQRVQNKQQRVSFVPARKKQMQSNHWSPLVGFHKS